MTPRERAQYLLLKFAFKGAQHEGEAKKFALIAVDEILISEPSKAYFIKNYWMTPKTYWIEVKEELNKL
jgi:hypothetical protein